VRQENNILYSKSFDFSIRIVKLYKYLCNEKKEYELAKQILRCGTSIGANISEAIEAQSKKDFIAKLSISLKEASETRYWLKLFIETDILSSNKTKGLLTELQELIKLLNSIIKTTKDNLT